ncbi:MAG: response regulator transcription factor [Muribaculaceae bacterium]|nr:response regulator transcription factor [Muribaculaceae bacterium]
MDQPTRVLVVEDDTTLCEMLQLNLELEGYDVDVSYSAEEAMRLNLKSYSLIILDVMMKEMSGFQMAKELKKNQTTAGIPIIFCTARDSEDDMVTGLNIGADDYIFKPYTIRNVLTRVKAVLRRTQKKADKDVINIDGIEIDTRFKRCRVDGKEVKLVKKEFEILQMLAENRGVLFSRQDILDRVWKDEVVILDRTVDVNITRIRQKIAPYGDRIITRQGYGYGFE